MSGKDILEKRNLERRNFTNNGGSVTLMAIFTTDQFELCPLRLQSQALTTKLTPHGMVREGYVTTIH
jgi:hypothetical protein